jgi:hypothetical protein
MNRPREITSIAVVAIVGSALSMLVGFFVASIAALAFHSIQQKYPGVTLHGPNPDLPILKEIVLFATVIPMVLGVIGLVSGLGLLRMRNWARGSMILWSVASSLFCIGGLIYCTSPGPRYIAPTTFLLPMLVLFPINAWWLLVLLRPPTQALFAKQHSTLYQLPAPEWLKENPVSKTIIALAAILLVILSASWIIHRNSSMREIERSQNALAAVKSWHYHTVRYIPGLPPETQDVDFACPAFQHSIIATGEPEQVLQVRETYHNYTDNYNRVGDHWLIAKNTADIFECSTGPIGMDQSALPLFAVIEDGSVKAGELKDLNGGSCREYHVTVPTPHDPKNKEFQFTICINPLDHLPRETRSTPPGWTQEEVSLYSNWNAISTELPAELK